MDSPKTACQTDAAPHDCRFLSAQDKPFLASFKNGFRFRDVLACFLGGPKTTRIGKANVAWCRHLHTWHKSKPCYCHGKLPDHMHDYKKSDGCA